MVIVVIHNLRKVGSLPYGYLPTWPWVVVAEASSDRTGFRVEGLEFSVQCLGFRVWGLEFRVKNKPRPLYGTHTGVHYAKTVSLHLLNPL